MILPASPRSELPEETCGQPAATHSIVAVCQRTQLPMAIGAGSPPESRRRQIVLSDTDKALLKSFAVIKVGVFIGFLHCQAIRCCPDGWERLSEATWTIHASSHPSSAPTRLLDAS